MGGNSEIISIKPNAHNNMGDVYSRWGDYENATVEFQKAIDLKPNYADAYHNLALTYQELEKDDEAIENYLKALEINPNLWQSYKNLASIYHNKGEEEKAQEYLNRAQFIFNQVGVLAK